MIVYYYVSESQVSNCKSVSLSVMRPCIFVNKRLITPIIAKKQKIQNQSKNRQSGYLKK